MNGEYYCCPEHGILFSCGAEAVTPVDESLSFSPLRAVTLPALVREKQPHVGHELTTLMWSEKKRDAERAIEDKIESRAMS